MGGKYCSCTASSHAVITTTLQACCTKICTAACLGCQEWHQRTDMLDTAAERTAHIQCPVLHIPAGSSSCSLGSSTTFLKRLKLIHQLAEP